MAYPGDSVGFGISHHRINPPRQGRAGKSPTPSQPGADQGILCCVDLNDKPELTGHSPGASPPSRTVVSATTSGKPPVCGTGCRIRRLTPRECLRLQGWTDERIDLVLPIQSDAQLYKQAGNGVTVNVVEAIGKRLAACPPGGERCRLT